VPVGNGCDVVGDDRSHEVAVLVEEEIARRVLTLVEVADRFACRGRQLHADKSRLTAEARRRALDDLAVRHADQAEVRVQLHDDGLAAFDQSGEVMSAPPGRIASQIAPKMMMSIAIVAPSAGSASSPAGPRTIAMPTMVGRLTARTRSR